MAVADSSTPPWLASVLNTEHHDVVPNSIQSACVCSCCCIINIVAIVLFFPCTVTQIGQFKYGLAKNKVTGYVDLDQAYTPGRYWIGFWKEFVEFPSTLNTIEFSHEKPEKGVQWLSPLKSRDMEGKKIELEISIQYKLNPSTLGRLYREMLNFYEDLMISELRDQLAKAANGFVISQIWKNYTSVTDLLTRRCEIVLTRRHSQCWGLQLWGVTLSAPYEEKLVQTQVRKQARKTEIANKEISLVQAQTQVMLANISKLIAIVKSEGEAGKYNLERHAWATAQANFVVAQAQSLQLVKDTVCLNSAKVYNGSHMVCSQSSTTSGVMGSRHLVEYQKQVLLRTLNSSNIVYNAKGGQKPQAMNVESSKKIMHGRARRLLLHEGEAYDDQHEERGIANQNIQDSAGLPLSLHEL
jgi:hypothetical protein